MSAALRRARAPLALARGQRRVVVSLPDLRELRPKVPAGFVLRVEAAIARDVRAARRRRTIAVAMSAAVAIAATFAVLLRAAAPRPASVEDVAWSERTLEGTEVVRAPWVTVTG